jgi:hypothetical protein
LVIAGRSIESVDTRHRSRRSSPTGRGGSFALATAGGVGRRVADP